MIPQEAFSSNENLVSGYVCPLSHSYQSYRLLWPMDSRLPKFEGMYSTVAVSLFQNPTKGRVFLEGIEFNDETRDSQGQSLKISHGYATSDATCHATET